MNSGKLWLRSKVAALWWIGSIQNYRAPDRGTVSPNKGQKVNPRLFVISVTYWRLLVYTYICQRINTKEKIQDFFINMCCFITQGDWQKRQQIIHVNVWYKRRFIKGKSNNFWYFKKINYRLILWRYTCAYVCCQ